MRLMHVLLTALFLTGCARYEYDIVEPADLARHIGRGAENQVVLQRDPLEYRFQSYEDRLVMRIINTTDQPVELLGDRSYAVDPHGESHPLTSQSIAPNSFIKLILPPMRTLYRAQPYIGFGITASRYPYYPYPYYSPYDPFYYDAYSYDDPWLYDTPVYLAADGGDPTFWTWAGQTNARLRLVYRHGDNTFHHEWLFRRRKM